MMSEGPVRDLVDLLTEVFADYDQPGVTLVRTDGSWYVSPIGTYFDQFLALARALDRAEIDALVEAVPLAAEALFEDFFGTRLRPHMDDPFLDDPFLDDPLLDDEVGHPARDDPGADTFPTATRRSRNRSCDVRSSSTRTRQARASKTSWARARPRRGRRRSRCCTPSAASPRRTGADT